MSGLGLGLGLGLGAHRKVGAKDPGELPATFTVTAGDGTDYVRVQVSETTTVTPAGGTSIRIGSSGEFATTPLTLVANTSQDIYFKDAGSFTIPKRKLVTYLQIFSISESSVIAGDITGMKLEYLYLNSLRSSAITGDITEMKLEFLNLANIRSSSVITGDITDMKLEYLLLRSISGSSAINGDITNMKLTLIHLHLYDIGLSVITGDITDMKLETMHLYNIRSSLTYGTNQMNINSVYGIQLFGNTVFATAAEYERLIIDAASGTWSPVGSLPFRIDAGTTDTDPGWDSVKTHVAVLLTKAAYVIIPSAWLEDNGGTCPEDWKEYTIGE